MDICNLNHPLVMTNIAMENGHRHSGISHSLHGRSFHSYGTYITRGYPKGKVSMSYGYIYIYIYRYPILIKTSLFLYQVFISLYITRSLYLSIQLYSSLFISRYEILIWLVVSTPLKNISSQLG